LAVSLTLVIDISIYPIAINFYIQKGNHYIFGIGPDYRTDKIFPLRIVWWPHSTAPW